MVADTKGKLVKARVICKQYGLHFMGDVVEVEESELARVPYALISLKEEAQKGTPVPVMKADPDFDSRKAAAVAQREQEQKSRRIVAKMMAERAKAQAAEAGNEEK